MSTLAVTNIRHPSSSNNLILSSNGLVTATAGLNVNGFITLSDNPTANLHAATKQYVDVAENRLNRLARSGSAVMITTSGTAFDIIGIPDWVNMVEIHFRGVSLSGTDRILVQLGTPSGFVTSGYTSGTGNRLEQTISNSGFLVHSGANSDIVIGILRIVRYNNNIWISDHNVIVNSTGTPSHGAGTVDLGGILDRIRVTRTGTNTFDAGEFIVKWSSQ